MEEEVKVKRGTLDDLIPDDRNMNRHTSYGMSLIEKSIRKNKFGRSILVDKNGRIIGGNGVTETAASIGATKTIVVETTGDELVVVKRTDVDLDSQQGREMALADNATAVADIEWDAEAVKEIEGEFEISPEDWGVVLDDEEEGEERERELTEQIYDCPLQLTPAKEYILVLCDKEDFDEARAHFGCGFVRQNNMNRGGNIVKSRTVNWKDYVNRNTKQEQTI